MSSNLDSDQDVQNKSPSSCRDPESFVNIFLVDEGRDVPSTTISGPSLARQRNAIKKHFTGMPMMAQH